MRQADRFAACLAARGSLPRSFICCVSTSPQARSGMSYAGVAARRAGMDDIHGVRLRFVDHHSACSCLQGPMAEAGDAPECRHAAGERARVDLACVQGLATGCKRGIDAAASGTVFCAGTWFPNTGRPLCLLPPRIILDTEGNCHRSATAPRSPFHGRGGRPKADHVGFLYDCLRARVTGIRRCRNAISLLQDSCLSHHCRLMRPQTEIRACLYQVEIVASLYDCFGNAGYASISAGHALGHQLALLN